MRVLELTWEYAPAMTGGLGVACAGICEALAADPTMKIVVAQPAAGGVQRGRPGKLPELILPEGAYSAPFEAVQLYSEAVEREFGAEAFDVVHAHDWLAFDAALRLHRDTGVPIVAHVHSLAIDRDELPNARILALERECLARASAIIAVSRTTRDRIQASCGIAAERIDVIHNGFDLPDVDPHAARDDLSRRSPRVTFVGRLVPQKAPDRFVEMARRIADSHPDTHFSVVGDGAMRDELQALVAAGHLGDRFTFHGFLAQCDVMAILRDSRLLVMPSRSEPFGLAALEAVAAGTPVLICRHAGLAEVITSLVEVDAGDAQALARACACALDDLPRADQLRRDAVGQLVGRSWDQVGSAIAQVLRRTCQPAASLTPQQALHLASLDT